MGIFVDEHPVRVVKICTVGRTVYANVERMVKSWVSVTIVGLLVQNMLRYRDTCLFRVKLRGYMCQSLTVVEINF